MPYEPRGSADLPEPFLEVFSRPQVDGAFGASAAIAEMLMQSGAGIGGGTIHLLPALPKTWAEGSFQGLRGRGGFEVDAAWKGGRLTSATVRSTLGGACCVRAACRLGVKEGTKEVPARRPSVAVAIRSGEDIIEMLEAAKGKEESPDELVLFQTRPGGTYTLTPEAKP